MSVDIVQLEVKLATLTERQQQNHDNVLRAVADFARDREQGLARIERAFERSVAELSANNRFLGETLGAKISSVEAKVLSHEQEDAKQFAIQNKMIWTAAGAIFVLLLFAPYIMNRLGFGTDAPVRVEERKSK